MFRGRQYRRAARDSDGSIVIDDDLMDPQPVIHAEPCMSMQYSVSFAAVELMPCDVDTKDYAPLYLVPNPASTSTWYTSSSSA